jgi:hypothetical protein
MQLFYSGCQKCIEYQDIAVVVVDKSYDSHIDSIAMKVNDSIIGCGDSRYMMAVGSKTHSINFPINVRMQLFSHGDLLKELFFEMSKNTKASIHAYSDCAKSSHFLGGVDRAKESNAFINSLLTNDYCWFIEKIGGSYEHERCTELSVDGPVDDIEERCQRGY